MKTIMDFGRDELQGLPKLKDWEEVLCESILMYSAGEEHESGWSKMVVIGCWNGCPTILITDYSDLIVWEAGHPLMIDSVVKSSSIHIWSKTDKFLISNNLSTINVSSVLR